MIVGSVAPLWLAALLYLGSGAGLLLVLAVRRLTQSGEPWALPTAKDWRWITGAIALGGVAGPAALMYGLVWTRGATASLLLNLEAVLTAMLAWFLFGKTSTAASRSAWWLSSPARFSSRRHQAAGTRRRGGRP